MNPSPFHIGEQQVQARLGVRDAIEPWARRVIRPYLTDQHRAFYPQLPFVVAAARDHEGRPWATLLVGAPGFLHAPDDRHLWIEARPLPGDALQTALTAGAEVGLLGIELETRRRNRVNGRISGSSNAGLEFEVGQAFGNCPQYITERWWRPVAIEAATTKVSRYQQLDDNLRSWIEAADTMFVASGVAGSGEHGAAMGMDASHRGGPRGFVHVRDHQHLVFPDYAGNNYFNTIGNLVMDPRIGLLFVDFERGSLLQITGTARLDWDSPAVAEHPGAQRLIKVEIEAVVHLDARLPLRWGDKAGATRNLRLTRRIRESEDVTSFVFEADDGGPLPPFEPGQHLPIELGQEGQRAPITRTYSLSNDPGDGHYRISVKRHSEGRASRLLHDELEIGDVIRSRPPAGDFVLSCGDRPAVLISAGVGITPLLSMLYRHCPGQSVTFIHGARDGAHHPFAAEVKRLAAADPAVTVHTSYSQPRQQDVPGRDYHRLGRVDGNLVVSLLTTLDADFYLCGPIGFLSQVSEALMQLGVAESRIHTESFGPAAV